MQCPVEGETWKESHEPGERHHPPGWKRKGDRKGEDGRKKTQKQGLLRRRSLRPPRTAGTQRDSRHSSCLRAPLRQRRAPHRAVRLPRPGPHAGRARAGSGPESSQRPGLPDGVSPQSKEKTLPGSTSLPPPPPPFFSSKTSVENPKTPVSWCPPKAEVAVPRGTPAARGTALILEMMGGCSFWLQRNITAFPPRLNRICNWETGPHRRLD